MAKTDNGMQSKILACYSLKGGVGKTACAVNIADLAARSGRRTLLIDLDPQGASSFYFRIKPAKPKLGKIFFRDAVEDLREHIRETDYANLDILPAHLNFREFDVLLAESGKKKKRLSKIVSGLRDDYDLIVFDCPPGIGHLSEAVFQAADTLLVPVIPSTLSERAYELMLEFLAAQKSEGLKVRPFFSMVQAQKSLHRSTMPRMIIKYPEFLRTPIPFSKDVENMGLRCAPLSRFAPTRPATRAFSMLFDELSRAV